jgi:hypothetical protein
LGALRHGRQDISRRSKPHPDVRPLGRRRQSKVYADADYAKTTEAGGIIAPPTFAQASAQFDPDYFLRPKIGQPWFGSGKNPTGVVRAAGRRRRRGGGGGLHAEQHFEYHRHLKPGDVLTATTLPGKTWEKEGRARASWCSPRTSPNTATRTASW